MSEPETALDDDARRRLAALFFGFGLCAVLIVVLGLVLAFREGATQIAFSWPTPSAFWHDVASLSSAGMLALGLFLLLLLPLVRNAAVTLVLLRRGHVRPALLALVVMLALILLYAWLALGAG